jgi:hypothetical protein
MKLYTLTVPLFFSLVTSYLLTTINPGRLAATTACQTDMRQLVAADTIPDSEQTGTGVLKAVDDEDYPFVTLTIAVPGKKTAEEFTINLDKMTTVKLATLTGLIGKRMSFHYTTEQVNELLDIEVGGKFLLDSDPDLLKKTTNKVTGQLGASEVSSGDIPGVLTITASDGEITEFPFFITSELLEVNGTTVTAFYEERTINTITEITVLR